MDSGPSSTRSDAQLTLLTMIEEAIAFLKADPTEAEAISEGIVGGDPPPWYQTSTGKCSPGAFQTFV
jgi:hypothetical protein